MKKKILFMVINMNVGGTEKALLTMLNEIDKQNYDVTILMLEEYGGFLKEVPTWVNIEYVKNYKDMKSILNNPLHITALENLKQGKVVTCINLISLYLLSKIKKERSCVFKYVLKKYPQIDDNYDIAIAYAGPMDFITYFVATKIKSKKKVQWIHFDITKIGFNEKFVKKFYNKFDKVFVVSKEGRDKLINTIQSLKSKAEVFSNIISNKNIQRMADESIGFNDDFNGTRILTVGRLSTEKGQDMTISVLARLKSEGYNVRWYCIGDGNARTTYEKMISNYNIQDYYVLLGSKLNPYPFIKECDIYVQPSRHEGYCITLAEARCFDNPIVSTSFVGANEQISHEETGLVCDISEDGLYLNIKKLLDDKKLINKIRVNLSKQNVDTTSEVKKLYKVLDEINYDNGGTTNEKSIIHGK